MDRKKALRMCLEFKDLPLAHLAKQFECTPVAIYRTLKDPRHSQRIDGLIDNFLEEHCTLAVMHLNMFCEERGLQALG